MSQDQSNDQLQTRLCAVRNTLTALFLIALCALEVYLSWKVLGKELVLDVNVALFAAALFYWSKPMARGVNSFAARCYERFPKLKVLPRSKYAGTELNYKIMYIWFRVCGAFAFISSVIFVILLLRLLRK